MESENVKQEKWYQSMTVKMILLGVMGVALIIPLVMIHEVITSREKNSEIARNEIGSLWAAPQVITGPVLNVPGTKLVDEDGRFATTTLHILPETLKVSAVLKPELRYRGIYETVVYNSEIHLAGTINLPVDKELNDYTWQWENAYVSLGVSDNKGISDEVKISFNGQTLTAQPGAGQADLFEKGIHFPVPIVSGEAFKGDFSFTLLLKGSGSLAFAPAGRYTEVNISSEWDAPSFTGKFLPSEREVTDRGFSASWVVTHLNRSFPQVWSGRNYVPAEDAFGVDLIIQADHYTKAERSVKYGILFIVITFFVLIIIELRSSQRLHIFYYFLVALALVLFFSLLTALSEQVGFNWAYLISSVATVGLLSAFLRSLFSRRWPVLVVAGILAVLYVFMFILLAMKDYAFLAGNIGLFVLLALLMMVSARYRLFKE